MNFVVKLACAEGSKAIFLTSNCDVVLDFVMKNISHDVCADVHNELSELNINIPFML